MADLRLQTRRFELGGKEYEVLLNMNVLADLQEAHGGNFSEILDPKQSFKMALEVLAAMLNEAADAAGEPERYTARGLGRILPIERSAEVRDLVNELLTAALAPYATDDDADDADAASEDSKN